MKNAPVFIIDDNPDELELLSLHLRKTGMRNITAFNCPVDALSVMHEGNFPRLVITDYQMGTVDGAHVAESILARSPRTKVIIYTGIPELVQEKAGTRVVEKRGFTELDKAISSALDGGVGVGVGKVKVEVEAMH
jgi:DNA-binding NtrC family response regulator